MRPHQMFLWGRRPLGIFSPDIGPVTDVLVPLPDLDQDSADANCETQKYGEFD
jgi:hypothetical protein